MTDYTLYYWPIPFRGQFVRAVLAHVGATWEEADFTTIAELRTAAPSRQPSPHMGPPVLTDHRKNISLAQTPAILTYLGRQHGLIPSDPEREALTVKVVADADDVLNDMTRHNGAQMWTQSSWDAFVPRLKRWMEIFEETGRRFRLTPDKGFLLASDAPGVADLVTYVLWHTMTTKLPTLRPLLEESAPAITGLCDRIAALPEQVELRDKCDAQYGNEWCTGQIEASLRAVLKDST